MFLASLQNLNLYLNGTKADTENSSNCNYFSFVVNNNLTFDEKAIFRVFLQNLDLYCNPDTTDNVDLRF